MPSYIHAFPTPAAVPGELPFIAYILSVFVCVKSEYAAYFLRLSGRASIAAGCGFGGAKGPDPSAAGERRCCTLLG